MKISIIIAHREVNDYLCTCGSFVKNHASSASMGLWLTVHSLFLDLENSGLEYEFCIQISGTNEKYHTDTYTILEYIKKTGKLGYLNHSKVVLSPPTARQMAVDNAKGEFLFFFDNHVIVKSGYFKRALESMKQYNMDMLHSTTSFYMDQPKIYHYTLCLEKNFWATGTHTAVDEVNPYRIAAGGHGGFIVKANVFREVGGYWTGFKGYGGEEIYFDLKMAMLDKTNWIDPQLIHYHYAGNRGYPRHYTDEFYVNMLSVANILGGDEWMNKLYDSFSSNYSKVKTGKTMFDLMDEAYDVSQESSYTFSLERKRTLDEQLDYFKNNHIPF
jgi:hypothetical protein